MPPVIDPPRAIRVKTSTGWADLAFSGSGDAFYTHTQGTLSATWNVVHNLNKHPSVTVVDTGDSVIVPDVHYVDANNLTLTFGNATSGKAYCN